MFIKGVFFLLFIKLMQVFEVRAVPNASNLAYTNNELIPHLDQNMLENAPGIQFFACLR